MERVCMRHDSIKFYPRSKRIAWLPHHWWAFPVPSEKDAVRWASTARRRTTMMTDAQPWWPKQLVGTQREKCRNMHTRLVVELSARTSRLRWNLEIFFSGIEAGIPRTDAWILTTLARWRVSDLIHATVAQWLRAKRLFAESRVRLPR